MHADEGTIHAWLDGELPPAEAAALEAHVASCTTCAAAVAEARGLVAASSRILGALDDVPAGVTPAIVKAATAGTARARQRVWRYPQFAAAAAAVILLVGSAVVYRQSAVGVPAAADAVTMQEASVPAVANAPMPAPTASSAAPSVEAARREDAAPVLPMRMAVAAGPNDSLAREAKAVATAAADAARAPETDSTSRRVLADAVVTSERERLAGEQRVQLAEARTPAAAPPPAAAKQAAGARNEVGGAAAGRASFSRDEAAVPGIAAPRCFDLQRSAAAVTAGVPPWCSSPRCQGRRSGGRQCGP
ncbi:MAG: zf-HC2 domain-containing protein [Gemmatimonadetes bacterium]|nr:zf-HC2 domain-containing protein [Gemmatimonadota bacterium]